MRTKRIKNNDIEILDLHVWQQTAKFSYIFVDEEEEEWIDVCQLPKIVPCGRKSARNSSRKYPYCRPRYKITSKSPRTANTFSKAEIAKADSQKDVDKKKKEIQLIDLEHTEAVTLKNATMKGVVDSLVTLSND